MIWNQSKQCMAYEIERHHVGYHLDNGKNVFQGRTCEDFLTSRLRTVLNNADSTCAGPQKFENLGPRQCM